MFSTWWSPLSGVLKQLQQHPSLRICYPAFFGSFLATSRTDLIIRLGRIFDREGIGASCTIGRCLEAMRDHPKWFTRDRIDARLTEGYRQANPDYLSHHQPIP